MICYIGLGSNLGDRQENLRRAIDLLNTIEGIDVKRVSPVYESEPWGPVKDQPDFLNAVIEVSVEKDAHELLCICQRIEQRMGRAPAEKWGPRKIDMDLLYCGFLVVKDSKLVLPHPRIAQRFFVLKPLSDLAAQWKDPVTRKTVIQMLDQLVEQGEGLSAEKKYETAL